MAFTGIAGGQAVLKTTGFGKSCVRAKESRFFNGYAYNKSAATVYFMIFDAAALPADTTVPTYPPIICPADSNANFDFWAGTHFATGVVIAASSTEDTLTLVVADDVMIMANVR